MYCGGSTVYNVSLFMILYKLHKQDYPAKHLLSVASYHCF